MYYYRSDTLIDGLYHFNLDVNFLECLFNVKHSIFVVKNCNSRLCNRLRRGCNRLPVLPIAKI